MRLLDELESTMIKNKENKDTITQLKDELKKVEWKKK